MADFSDPDPNKHVQTCIENQITLLESYISTFYCHKYHSLSRARTYLVVIGKLGGKERYVRAAELSFANDQIKNLGQKVDIDAILSKMNDKNEWLAATGKPTLMNGEHKHFNKEHFLYRIVDVDDSANIQESPEVEYYDPTELMPGFGLK